MVSRATPGRSTAASDDDNGRDGEERESLSRDVAFHLVQNGRRRAVLRYLFDHEELDRVRMCDVAEAVAAWDHDKPVERLRSDERQRVYIALYQSHLPKLDEHGVVDYDRTRGTISLRRLAYALVPLLEDGLETSQSLRADETGAADESASGLLSRFGL